VLAYGHQDYEMVGSAGRPHGSCLAWNGLLFSLLLRLFSQWCGVLPLTSVH
jgi:hypothetical protein